MTAFIRRMSIKNMTCLRSQKMPCRPLDMEFWNLGQYQSTKYSTKCYSVQLDVPAWTNSYGAEIFKHRGLKELSKEVSMGEVEP